LEQEDERHFCEKMLSKRYKHHQDEEDGFFVTSEEQSLNIKRRSKISTPVVLVALIPFLLVTLFYPKFLTFPDISFSNDNDDGIEFHNNDNNDDDDRCNPDMIGKKKIVVVGAGASGLTAAKRLMLQHHSPSSDCWKTEVTVLEASSIIGGRVAKDTEWADYPLDLGASFVRDPELLATISQNPTIRKELKQKLVNPEELYDAYRIKKGKVKSMAVGGEDEDNLWRNYTWWDFLSEHVASALEPKQFVFNCAVDSIVYLQDQQQTMLRCGDKTFVADYVVLTVPLSILLDGDIQFDPQINPSIFKSQPSKFWKGFKIFLEFSHKFYYDYFEFIGGEGELDFWDFSLVQINATQNILGGYYMGEHYDPLDGMTEDQLVKKVLDDLDDLFGDKQATKYYMRHKIVHWANDYPYIRGTYSIDYPVKGTGPQEAWSNKRLLIAGEAFPIPRQHNGWVDTAALSGLHAAEIILYHIDNKSTASFSIPRWMWKGD
jgi:monoamine oxidase